MKRHIAVISIGFMLIPAGASADDAISPVNGEIVGSRPVFAYDFANGVGEVELSRSPDVLTAGDNAGAFVESVASDYALLYTREPRDGLAPFPTRLDAGLYYWHVRTRNDGLDSFSGTTSAWGPVRTLTVRDEPIVIEGWTVKKNRLRQRGACKRLRLRGTVAYNDNDRTPRARLQVVVQNARGRVIMRLSGPALFSSASYDGIFCSAATRVKVTPYMRDRAGHLTVGASRWV